MFSHDVPDGAEEELHDAMAHTQDELVDLIEQLFATHGEEIERVAREMKPCEYCATQHYEEFIVRELVNRGLTELGEDGEFAALIE